jgi:hypothetical protein
MVFFDGFVKSPVFTPFDKLRKGFDTLVAYGAAEGG